jgi:hypothetical protein
MSLGGREKKSLSIESKDWRRFSQVIAQNEIILKESPIWLKLFVGRFFFFFSSDGWVCTTEHYVFDWFMLIKTTSALNCTDDRSSESRLTHLQIWHVNCIIEPHQKRCQKNLHNRMTDNDVADQCNCGSN